MAKIKRGLMTQFPFARGRAFVCKNIGDYVQAVATRQFVHPIDEYIEQEEANNYFPDDKQPIRLIMNGWFQWRSENWPPSEYIHPLLVSMHISPLKADDLLKEEGIAFLKKNGPVGCRDYYTKNLLESKGVPAYFSGCMTLTLGRNYKVDDSLRHGVYFVDPYFEIPDLFTDQDGKKRYNITNIIMACADVIRFYPTVSKLAKKPFFKVYSPKGFLDRSESKFRPYYKAAEFYKFYSKKFDRDLILNANYVTHWMDVDMSGAVTNDTLLDIAEDLIKQYASAKLVVTSRIHSGLPCLAVDTPVVFIANQEVLSEKGTFNTPGRLGGLVELFRVLSIDKSGFNTEDPVLKTINRFELDTTFQNKRDWEPYARELEEKAIQFMSE